MRKKIFNKLLFFLLLMIPVCVNAADYMLCGNDKKIPLVFGQIMSILFIIIKIMVPILLIITGMISFLKATLSGKVDDELQKAKKSLVNKIIAAVIIFFIISIVNFAIALVAGRDNSFSSCLNCMIHPSNCQQVDSDFAKLCPGLLSQQQDYDDNCNYIGNKKERINYGYTGGTGVPSYAANNKAYAVSKSLVSGGLYSSNVPAYNTSADFLANVNYDYYATVAQAGQSSSGYSFYGECPWYAKGRAIEIVSNSNMPDDIKQKVLTSLRGTNGNGGEWYSNTDSNIFQKTTDIYAAKAGSIVSWSQANAAGHVGIVEEVEYENGKAKRILLSEGWNGTGNPGGTSYQLKWWDVEQFRHYYGNHNFIGYVYLLG